MTQAKLNLQEFPQCETSKIKSVPSSLENSGNNNVGRVFHEKYANTAIQSWGYHLILDAKECKKNFNEPKILETFVVDLLKRINMNAWGTPWITHFAEKPEIAGWTVIQPLTTSSLTIHFLDINGDMYFDLFSCKTFDIEMVKSMIIEYFDPISMKDQYLVRQA